MRPALEAKSRSRGKIQLRCCQGRRASALSQRQRVVPLTWPTIPWAITSRRILARESRESGSPRRCGSSQARAFTCTTTLGGKEGGTAAPRLLLQAGQSHQGKSFAPLAHDLARRVQACGDHIVGHVLRGQEHDFSSNDIAIR